ncbi:MAG: 16S rRNA (guanine(527)-N(7))-methyltransferase RsmG [Spirochaetaceae bacterium]|jgi:16S rRNA (guanine527-N7)-methyltransferase|nr:16S rRNA (guanine(527)-N(7))-methyltransferase RsmG [Spirochaetaceae bacterium]
MDALKNGLRSICNNSQSCAQLIEPRFEEIIKVLQLYINEIELFNNVYGLVSYRDKNELVIKHILDSVAAAGIIADKLPDKASVSIADAGSGAGLPGIPLAAVFSHVQFTLIERMERRSDFLQNTTAVLNLKNTIIIQSDLSAVAASGFDLITFRAFHPLDLKLYKQLKSRLSPTGFIAAYKGRIKNIQQEMNSLPVKPLFWEIIPCEVPFLNEERHILIIKP